MEIYVFANERLARDQGFRGPGLRHVQDPNMRAISALNMEQTRGIGLDITRVVITDYANRAAHQLGYTAYAEFQYELNELWVRASRNKDLIWIEL